MTLQKSYYAVVGYMIIKPSFARRQYWSRMKDFPFCFEKNTHQKSKQAAFHVGPVLPRSGEGSSLAELFHFLLNQ